ncbi:ATP-binding cassette domain-containing protein [Brevibacillus laterosporus]
MAIHFQEVTYSYQFGHLFQETALDNINVGFTTGSFTAIIGPSGCGKSTLLQHMNGILLPTKGQVHVLDHVITPRHSKRGFASFDSGLDLFFNFQSIKCLLIRWSMKLRLVRKTMVLHPRKRKN